MSDALTHATLVAETVLAMQDGALPAIRVIPHNDDGSKPRGKAGKGLLVVGKKGETHADVLRTVAAYLEQEGVWSAFSRDRVSDV